MKLYLTTSEDAGRKYAEFATSGAGASKTRTKLKAAKHMLIVTEEVEVSTKRSDLIEFLNDRFAAKI